MSVEYSDRTLSFVIPCFNEEGNVSLIGNEIITMVSEVKPKDFEILFVDDGSTDNTWASIVTFNNENSKVKGISFTRNFGHSRALEAGIRHSTGDVVIMLDADMQHPVSVIPEMLIHWENGAEIVNTIRATTNDVSISKKWLSKFFYFVINRLSDTKINDGEADFRLVTRKVADTILAFREPSYFFRGLVNWTGFETKYVTYEAPSRLHGHSKFSMSKMLDFARIGITSSSKKPLMAIIYIGGSLLFFSFLVMLGMLIAKYGISYQLISTSSILVVFSIFVVSFLVCVQGIIAAYLVDILDAVRMRPNYLIGDRTN